MNTLADSLGRRITYLRVSVVDSCNLRCVYCMPSKGIRFTKRTELMSPEEIGIIAKAASSLGTRVVRITGGEPLTRPDVADIASELSAIPAIEDIPLSTNGIFLKDHAWDLADAGVTRVNVSIDSLNPDRFREITRGGELSRVIEGVRTAADAGMRPVKINTVLMKGVNDRELVELARFALENSYTIRFIEMMPLSSNVSFQPGLFLPAALARREIERQFRLTPSTQAQRNGPAVYYDVDGYESKIGFITPLSGNFCERCNRVRITSKGKLRMCLFGDDMFDLLSVIRQGGGVEGVSAMLRECIRWKPDMHHLGIGRTSSATLEAMSQIGG
ncbi:MAG: GTP 3',8-cyclase MoaA [Thermoplasmata archaeon]|uniref:GTP 3',8-cyclase n=1 Tax=Candidatus Sysuiplasma superficiale TaxID=2823368 RepID=A0A8J7YSW9_9ARCH|nr:GTP 3',8-cyclase MoaA [Candidatus Sysuiplasma superficiale]MBX8644658.1 GTP 3',8-cyclase MoaA [Candidatus Sysuiplasma superficiale]MCL4347434.1 GTP 3',8-cyclase MoaA [Candidatus Thermoplasmatota archaeon]